MKHLISLILSLAFILTLAPSAFAASEEAVDAANSLYELGLFSGTGTDANGNPIFDLDRAPTRHEAITMLVRLLGKTDEAENGTWNMPFTDVADWAKPYVGYAYNNQLVSGTSVTTFGGNDTVSAAQYLTFVLRALGYESGADFQWDKAWELSDVIGLTDGQYNAETTNFSRGDVAIISQRALSCKLKNQTQPLQQVSPNIPSKAPSPNLATNETKVAIMEKVIDGLYAEKAGLENCAKAAEFLSIGQSKYSLQFCKESIKNLQTAVEKFNSAISLCANYTDTKTVKENLVSICDNLSSICAVELTEQNFIDYLVNGVIIGEENKILQDTIQQEFENWADSAN